MRVIGTAGHVDHGKTTLIEALTGINADRLPEEKARGMTIDLGFAWFTGGRGEAIGVIDVPGHERFIRNMVAGAWSLDCGLLLVAADDGWMQQTQDHAVVLAAHGIPAVILVITKIDAAATARVAEVRRDALARAAVIFGTEPVCAEVAALSGAGVDSLKDLIIATLAKLPESPPEAAPASAAGPGFPYLYVDRVFTMKGSGLVVTGSLKGGPITKDMELVLLPAREPVRIRALQTYNQAVESTEPTSRVALNLPRPKSEVSRGDCITSPGAPFFCERELFAHIEPVDADDGTEQGIRNHSEVEIALGTGHQIAQVHFLDDRRFARIQMREPLPALWNQPFLVLRHGGSEILATGRTLWFGEVQREDRRRLGSLLGSQRSMLGSHLTEMDRFDLELRFRGLARTPAGFGADRAIAKESVVAGSWIFHTPWLEKLKAGIVKLAGSPAGISAREIASKLRIEPEALEPVLALLQAEGAVVPRNTLYFLKAADESSQLSPGARTLLSSIEGNGRAAFEASRAGIPGTQKDLSTLVRLGLVVPLEGGLFYSRATYDAIKAEVLAQRRQGDRFSIPEAKERTGLSRKFMIPLLNRMEKDGLLRRDGDARVVLPLAAATPAAASPAPPRS
jgi:selenocysteine-specific elongation factor